MKNTQPNNLKKITSYILVLSMIVLNLSFASIVKAGGEILTIGSQSASNGETITVPITATFSDIRGVQFHINYNSFLLESLEVGGCSSDYLDCNSDVGFPFPGKITITWYDVNNPLSLSGEILLNLQFNVISEDVTDTDITFSTMTITNTSDEEIQDSVIFNDGTITLNPDTTAPTLLEVTPVSTPTNDTTPNYTFNSNEAGTIIYGGDCTSATTDAVAGDNTITFNTLSDGIYNSCTITVTDESDNTSNPLSVSLFTIDTVIPVITLLGEDPVNLYVDEPYEDAGATALDNIDGDITNSLIIIGEIVNTSIAGTYIITYNVSDSAGNPADEVTRTVNVSVVPDTTSPVITLLGNDPVTVEVGTAYNDAGATALDNVDGDITNSLIIIGEIVDTSTVGIYTVIYNVTDSSGNPATEVTRTVNVVDTTSPVITLLGDDPVTIEVGSTYNDMGTTASDNYDGNITENIVKVNPVNSNIVGVYTVTYNVSDSSGNPASEVTRTVNVVDTTVPEITLLGDDPITIEVGTTYNDAGATASDNYDGDITESIVTINPVNVNTIGTYMVTYNVTDFSGNPATEIIRIVNVIDTTAPIITLLGSDPVTIEVGSTYNDAGATANDNADGNISNSINKGGDTVDTNTLGTYVITYNVIDSAENPATEVTRTVNVVDTTAPIITLIGNNPVTIVVGDEYDDSGATANDNYDGDITESVVVINPVDVSTVGTYYVTYNVIDSSGNSATEIIRTVNVVDITTPVISLLGDNPTTIEVGSTYNDAGATAADDVDGDITDDIITINSVDSSVIETYLVTYNVSDSSGNPAPKAIRTVNVVDTTVPVITLLGDNPTSVEVGYQYNDAGAMASDNYDGDITENIVIVSNVDYNTVGSYTVTYNVTDLSENSAEEIIRIVNITPDVTLPVITLIGDDPVNVYVDGTYEDAGATALDNIDGDITSSVVTGGDTVDTSTAGTYIVTYNVSDTTGNPANEVTRTIIVSDDTTAPVITLLGENPTNLYVGDTYTDAGATALDNVDGDITENIVVAGDTVDTSTAGTYTITYNVSDAVGNLATEITRIVNVNNRSSGGGGSSYTPPSTTKGDINKDKKVDKYDLALMMAAWGKTGSNNSDLNKDKKVDKYDFALLMASWKA